MPLTLAAAEGGTRMIWCMGSPSAEIGERYKPLCIPANEGTFDRLAGHLG